VTRRWLSSAAIGAASAVIGVLAFDVAAIAAEPEDPLQYLEDARDPRTVAFYAEQGAAARGKLDAIPGRAELLARIRALSQSGVTISSLALTPSGRLFYLRQDPRRAHPTLCVRESLNSPERELLDPARFDRGDATARIEWHSPAPDGRHVAYGIAVGEGGDAVLRVLAVDSRQDLPGEIDRARFNESLAWHPDAHSFYYARYPEGNPKERLYARQRIYRHVLGREAARDEIVFAPGVGGARDVPDELRAWLHVPSESSYAYAIAREGVARELAVHVTDQKSLAAGRPQWRKLAGVEDEVLAVTGWHDELYLLSRRNAPRHRVLRMKGSAALSSARVVVKETDVVIDAMALAQDALYLRMMLGGVDRLERVALGLLGGAKAPEFVRVPFDNAIAEMVGHPRTPGVLLRLQGWIEAPAVVQVEARTGNIRDTRVQPRWPLDFSAIDEVRLYATGPDGTRIPVTLLYRKSTRLTGDNPTLLVADGVYGEPVRPRFDAARLAWLERGGVFAIAHVRGGGEYGSAWHLAGRGAAKANGVQDFIAVAEFLVRYGFTAPARLAASGSGAGAIPAAVAAARRPELFGVLVVRTPLADLLRYERMADGAAQVPELGSAASPAGAERLRAVSAYHFVKAGVAYPAALVTAAPDPHVESWQAAKLAASLAQANEGLRPVLLKIDDGARPRHDENLADTYAFLLAQMGDPAFAPPAPPPPEPMGPPAPAPEAVPASRS
jgi:prolyl oligopeptidase